MAKNSVVTIYDVADLANVSMATVSRVLNNPDKVNIITKERVLNAVEKLGYVPNPIARDLAMKKTTSINMVVSNITSSYVSHTINGILNTIDKLKFSLKISTISKNEKVKEFINYNIAEKVRGVILINEYFNDDDISLIKNSFDEHNIELVILNTRIINDEIMAYNFGVNVTKKLLQNISLD